MWWWIAGWLASVIPLTPSLELEFPSSKRMALSPREYQILNPITAEIRPGDALLALLALMPALCPSSWPLVGSVISLSCEEECVCLSFPRAQVAGGVSHTLNLVSTHCCPSLGSHALALWSTLCCCLVLVGQ